MFTTEWEGEAVQRTMKKPKNRDVDWLASIGRFLSSADRYASSISVRAYSLPIVAFVQLVQSCRHETTKSKEHMTRTADTWNTACAFIHCVENDSDTSWEENAMKKRERERDARIKKTRIQKESKGANGNTEQSMKGSREEPALNSQIIENAVSVSAHNVYRSRTTFWHKTCVLSNCSQKLS